MIIIDGYNLMWTTGILNPIVRFNHNLAKELLIKALVDYQKRTGEEVVLVLDGYKSPNPYTKREWVGGLDVVYTAKDLKADRWIMNSVGRNEYPDSIVVTSDREIADYVKAKEVPVLTSKKFEKKLITVIDNNIELMDEIHRIKREYQKKNVRKIRRHRF